MWSGVGARSALRPFWRFGPGDQHPGKSGRCCRCSARRSTTRPRDEWGSPHQTLPSTPQKPGGQGGGGGGESLRSLFRGPTRVEWFNSHADRFLGRRVSQLPSQADFDRQKARPASSRVEAKPFACDYCFPSAKIGPRAAS